MNIDFYIKDNMTYKKVQVDCTEDTQWSFLQSLKLSIEVELEHIKNDIINLYDNKNDVILTNPRSSNSEIQQKFDTLVLIRKHNSDTMQILNALMAVNDCIPCDRCSGKMYRIPLFVKYTKVGHKYIIKEDINMEKTRYIYGCESCHSAIGEDAYNEMQNNIKLKDQLLKESKGFVPSKYGFWHHQLPYHPDALQECDHSWKREFEYINIENVKSPFVKIIEHCPLCGEKRLIR